jgi:hypothetical protein
MMTVGAVLELVLVGIGVLRVVGIFGEAIISKVMYELLPPKVAFVAALVVMIPLGIAAVVGGFYLIGRIAGLPAWW